MTEPSAIVAALHECVDLDTSELRAEPLVAGHSHESWRIRSEGGDGGFLLKIAKRNLRPEKVQNAVAAQRLATSRGVRVPRVLGVCFDSKRLGRPYYVQRWVRGQDAEIGLTAMTPRERTAFADDLGREIGLMHAIEGERFADDVLGSQAHARWPAYVAWRLAFVTAKCEAARALEPAMLEAVRTECDRLVREVVVDFPPSLVHGDLHPRNVVVDRAEPSGALRLAALLDFEHARFLDPAWDFVKLDLWVFAPHPDLEAPFRAAYRAARGESESFRSRVRLCGGLEILRALPYFGAEFPDEAMFDSFFTALERWLAG